MTVSVFVAILSVSAIFVMAGLAYLEDKSLPSQARRHLTKLSFLADGRALGMLFLITPALYIICKYSDGWRWAAPAILLSIAGCLAVQGALRNGTADSLIEVGSTSPAGYVYVVYIAVVIALTGLFLFCSTPTTEHVAIVWTLLLLHALITNRKVLMNFD